MSSETTTAAAPTAADLLRAEAELPDSEPDFDLKPKPKAQAPAPSAPKHSPRMLRLAAHVGLTPAEVEASSPEELRQSIAEIQLEHQQVALEDRLTRSRPAAPVAAPTPEPEEEIDWGEWEDEDASGVKVKRKATSKDIAQPIVKVLVETRRELKELRAEREKEKKSAEESATATRVEQIDAAFDSLGEAYHPVFSKGKGRELQPTDTGFMRRRALLASLHSDPPKESLSLADAIKKRAAELYGERKAASAVDPLLEYPAAPTPTPRRALPKDPETGRFTKEEWDDMALPAPTARRGSPEPKGKPRAVKALTERMRSNGTLEDFTDRTLEDELPDDN